MATQKFFACSRLNVVDPDKAANLGSREPVYTFVDRYRGQTTGKPHSGCFVFYKGEDGEQLRIEPLQFARTPEGLIERLGKQVKNLLAAGFLSRTELKATIQNVDGEQLKRLIARAFGANHKSGVMLAQFRKAKVAPGSATILEIVESFGLECSRD